MNKQENTPQKHQTKLKLPFIPSWIEDFQLIRDTTASTYIVYQILKFYSIESPTFEINKITEGAIRSLTGFDFKTIRQALKRLENLGKIIKTGYCRYRLANFFKFSTTSGETPEPAKNHLGRNSRTDSGKTPDNFGNNSRLLRENFPNPLYLNKELEENLKENGGDKSPVQEEEYSWLRMQFPFCERSGLKIHLANRGYTELEVSQFLESFYNSRTPIQERPVSDEV
jgi:hypothetical protein